MAVLVLPEVRQGQAPTRRHPARAAGGAGHHGHVGSQPQDHPSPQSHYAPMLLCQADEVSRGSCHVSDTSVRQVQGKRADTVGHSISTQHSYCYCVGLSIFLGLQRQHMRGTIFGMWGMTNSIRAISARSPQKKCYAYPRCTFLSNSGAAGQGGNLRHCERVFFNMRLVAPTCLLLEEKSPLLSDIPVLCYRRAEEHASLETRQDGQTVRRSCASTTPRTVGMPMVGRLV